VLCRRAHSTTPTYTAGKDSRARVQHAEGTLVKCVKTPPNPALGELLDQTGTLVPGKDENTIQIKFISGKITWPREHADYITAREPNCLWRITDIRPDTNNNIMVTVNPVKRNNSKRIPE